MQIHCKDGSSAQYSYDLNYSSTKQNILINFNRLKQRRNGQHFADDIFKHIFFNENIWISINISLKFVPEGPINNIPALIQIIAWHCPGIKPLSEPMMVNLQMHIYASLGLNELQNLKDAEQTLHIFTQAFLFLHLSEL